jgi:hypothetical protein
MMKQSGNPRDVTVGGVFVGAGFAAMVIGRFYGSLPEAGVVFTSCVLNAPDHALGDRIVLQSPSSSSAMSQSRELCSCPLTDVSDRMMIARFVSRCPRSTATPMLGGGPSRGAN